MLKRFHHCPRCQSILLQSYNKTNIGDYWTFKCMSASHIFSGIVDEKDDNHFESIVMSLSMEPLLRVVWNFDLCTIDVGRGTDRKEGAPELIDEAAIPWFMPDFQDIPKLINKIKTYILFS